MLRHSGGDAVTVAAAGVTLHEALKAYATLRQEGLSIRVIDLYSVKPVDKAALEQAARQTGCLLAVEDHYAEGGLGDAVRMALSATGVPVHALAVRQMPGSGAPEELLAFEQIDSRAIAAKVRELAGR